MATSESAKARAPRGAKAVVTAFLSALDSIPDARRVEVAKAAQVTIRDEVKSLAVKAKEAARKPAGRKPVAHKVVARKVAAPGKPAALRKMERKAPAVAMKKAVAPTVARRAKGNAVPVIAA